SRSSSKSAWRIGSRETPSLSARSSCLIRAAGGNLPLKIADRISAAASADIPGWIRMFLMEEPLPSIWKPHGKSSRFLLDIASALLYKAGPSILGSRIQNNLGRRRMRSKLISFVASGLLAAGLVEGLCPKLQGSVLPTTAPASECGHHHEFPKPAN